MTDSSPVPLIANVGTDTRIGRKYVFMAFRKLSVEEVWREILKARGDVEDPTGPFLDGAVVVLTDIGRDD